jgi:hypothetical protein
MERRPQREHEVELPIGYVDADGVVHRTAVLRKMTGRDEAIMADKRHRHNGARMITELLGSCLLRLGTIEAPGTAVARAMYSADRHYLLMKLRQVTFGPEMQATYSCPTCHEANVVVEDLDELETVTLAEGELPEDVTVRLEDGYVDRGGQVHDLMVFRHATGADEEKVAAAVRENAARGRDALMVRCLKSLGDMPQARMEGLGTSIFGELTLGDRALIDRKLNNGGPGMKLRREVACAQCGRKFTASLDLSGFLASS